MPEQSEDKSKKTTTIDKKADDLLKTSKDNKVELTEEELKRIVGGDGAAAAKPYIKIQI